MKYGALCIPGGIYGSWNPTPEHWPCFQFNQFSLTFDIEINIEEAHQRLCKALLAPGWSRSKVKVLVAELKLLILITFIVQGFCNILMIMIVQYVHSFLASVIDKLTYFYLLSLKLEYLQLLFL